MASVHRAEVFHWQPLSTNLATFRLKSVAGSAFPEYQSGQNIELRRGDASMIFSIVSAPFESKQNGYLEFFVDRNCPFVSGSSVEFASEARGDFTLERTRGYRRVVLVATGTGVAPFVSMLRELNHSPVRDVQFTLVHGSRKFEELGYYKELSALASAAQFDFLYAPTVSRPIATDRIRTSVGKGRAGSVLRRMFGLAHEGEIVLPDSLTGQNVQRRLDRHSMIILACGSHASVADIESVAQAVEVRVEKEDW